MKKITCLIILLIGFSTYSQTNKSPCVSDELTQKLIESNPEIKLQLELFEKQIAEKSNANKSASSIPLPGTITIPVAIYVVHDGTSLTNISDNQVNIQITALNNYFLNTGIKFCLATTSNGSSIPTVNGTDVQTTPGIIHVNNAALSSHNSSTQQSALVNTAHQNITKDRYLRIWIVKSIDGLSSGPLGYSMFPNTSPIFDGIVMRSDVFGNGNPNMYPNYNQGKVLVHEVGHYLGLHHTFEGGCSATNSDCLLDGDRVCDTPPVAAPNFTCVPGTDSCAELPNALDDITNYMDYGNNTCQSHFTIGQTERMLNVLFSSRSTLFSSDNILYTGTCGSSNLVSATITPSDYSPCTSATNAVTFTALPAQSYVWDFGDSFATVSNPNTANTQNPSHIYTSSANSPYTVTLTVTGSNGQTAISSIQIFVTDCSPIANSNTYWYIDASFGMSFNSGKPVFDPTFPYNNYANLSCNFQNDSSGNLLFYTNKFKVWNNQHQQINATDIMLNTCCSKSNQVLIVPKPPLTGNTISEYYIFTQQGHNSGAADAGFRYNIVNVTGTNATMGPIAQPITLPSTYGFAIASDGSLLGGTCLSTVKKCNSNDYWVITLLKKGTVPYLVVFSLTSSGLIYNSERMVVNGSIFLSDSSIEISPSGNKLFLMSPYATPSYIYDFNKAQGLISSNYSTITLPQTQISGSAQMVGYSFSPDSNLLYATSYFAKKIYQFNINAINIDNTRKEIASTIDSPWDLQIGPDNKLYVGMNNALNNMGKHGVIHNPDKVATVNNPNNCNFSPNGPKPIINTSRVGPSLPNIIDAKQETAYFNANTANVISTYITGCRTYKFFPNICGTSFNWEFTNTTLGTTVTSTSTNPIYTFPSNGIYTITLKDNANVIIGSTAMEITGATTPLLLGSTTACLTQPTANITNNSTILEAGGTATWSITGGVGSITGPNNQSSVNVNWTTLPGTLSLTTINNAGCSNTTTQTITSYCPNLSTPEFLNNPFVVVPNPSNGMFTIEFKQFMGKVAIQVIDMRGRIIINNSNIATDNIKTLDLTHCQNGIYILKINGAEFNYFQKIIKN